MGIFSWSRSAFWLLRGHFFDFRYEIFYFVVLFDGFLKIWMVLLIIDDSTLNFLIFDQVVSFEILVIFLKIKIKDFREWFLFFRQLFTWDHNQAGQFSLAFLSLSPIYFLSSIELFTFKISHSPSLFTKTNPTPTPTLHQKPLPFPHPQHTHSHPQLSLTKLLSKPPIINIS